MQEKAITTSSETEEEERNQPNKKDLEDNDDDSLSESCSGHQILHFLLIFNIFVRGTTDACHRRKRSMPFLQTGTGGAKNNPLPAIE